MKRIVLMIIPALICGATFIGCDSDKTKNTVSELQYIKTELGGCNIKSALETEELEPKDDVLTITVSDESVHVFVGLNYTCKELPFVTRCETADDVLYMYISDSGGDYYRCDCYYTFDFIFKQEGTTILNQKYKILLIDKRKENPVIISEGILAESI